MTRGGGELGKADMHLHTLYSDGTVSVQALLDHVEAQTDLDVIAITDHERIDGALRAREMHAAGELQLRARGRRGDHHPARPRAGALHHRAHPRVAASDGDARAHSRPGRHRDRRASDGAAHAVARHAIAARGARHRGSPSSARRDRADEPVGCGPSASSGPRQAQPGGPPPGRRRQLGRARARGDRHGVDVVPRLDGRRLPERPSRRARRGRTARSGRTVRTSTCTGDSCVPRSGTCGILFGQRESGGDIGSVRAVDDGAIGPARRARSRSAEGRDREPVRLPASRAA